MGACKEALDWARSYEDPLKAWQECQHGRWLWWILSKAELLTYDKTADIAADVAERALQELDPELAKKVTGAITAYHDWKDGRDSKTVLDNERAKALAAAYQAYPVLGHEFYAPLLLTAYVGFLADPDTSVHVGYQSSTSHLIATISSAPWSADIIRAHVDGQTLLDALLRPVP